MKNSQCPSCGGDRGYGPLRHCQQGINHETDFRSVVEQPAAEYLQFLSDVMTASGLVTHGKQCKALGERLRTGASKFRNIAQPAQGVAK